LLAGALGHSASAQVDALPSWNDGAAKRAIVDFVARTTTAGNPQFVAEAERIAVFDNDGTLWAEQPIYFQFAFALDRVKAMAPQHPEWKEREPFKSVLAGDMAALAASGNKGVMEIVAATHAGITTEQFTKDVTDWLATARHPRFDRPYTDLVYQPMIELLEFLRAHQFKTFIVSGGGVEFMRPWVEKVYGIPPEQVVGSSLVARLDAPQPDKPVLIKEPKVEFIDDGPGKPVGINRFIGRRPVFAFGNSDGDQQMLEWTAAGPGARFMGLVHHTDEVREYAYDRQSRVGKLDKAWDEALRRHWTIVDMKADWNTVFPFQRKAAQLANPASQNCVAKGGTLLMQESPRGQYGVCVFKDHHLCEEWAMLRGNCPVGGVKVADYLIPAARYCVVTGGRYDEPSRSCTLPDGKVCNVEAHYAGGCP
jgi:putative hemolysin/phosphoglycolate phosphatase-like HAD superfamily hydrolase